MSYDPLGHLRLSVSDFEKSRQFYDELLGKLGCKKVSEKGWATKDGLGIWLIEANPKTPAYVWGTPGLHHLCLKAESPEAVDQLHQFLVSAGVPIFATPQRYPQYTDEYYAVFFADPDGIQLEVAYY